MATDSGQDRTTMVFTSRGSNKPGVANAFVQVVAKHAGRVLDMVQFLLEGSLVFQTVVQVGSNCPMVMVRDLLHEARQRDMEMDFHFPAGDAEEFSGENLAEITVACAEDITPKLLHGLDAVVSDKGCVVQEIVHRSDDKIEINGEYNKLSLKVRCPKDMQLSTLYMGDELEEELPVHSYNSEASADCSVTRSDWCGDVPATAQLDNPQASWASTSSLQGVAWENRAVVTTRWWNAMNRPSGKSLVVFGLSNVLCPYDVLDAVLEEAGVDCKTHATLEGIIQQRKAKVARLKGHSTACVQRVISKLQFTRGARLVCAALRAMGCHLAILSNTAVQEVAEYVKSELGIDYAMCQNLEVDSDGKFTGEYAGDASAGRFRKAERLKNIADFFGIEYRNVIVVGGFLCASKPGSARLALETFGLNIFFSAERHRDITMVLYLLGFSGSNVRTLRGRYDPSETTGETPTLDVSEQEVKRFIVQVSTRSRQPGQIQHIFNALLSFGAQARIGTVRQCSLRDGGMCLGLDLRVWGADKSSADRPAKELVYICQQDGFQIFLTEAQAGAPAKAPSTSWEHYSGQNRYVLTVVQKPRISIESLREMLGVLSEQAINIMRIDRMSADRELSAFQLTCTLPATMDNAMLARKLLHISNELGADIAIQRDDVDRWMRRLVVFDMDSTLIQQEVFIELARIAGVEEAAKALLEARERDKLDLADLLKDQVALLKGRNAEKLFTEFVEGSLHYTPGARSLCTTLQKMGYKTAVVSSGFLPVAEAVKRHLGLDYAFANILGVDGDTGLLTGSISEPLLTDQRKHTLLAEVAKLEGCPVDHTIAVGDGGNDIEMLSAAGAGIAFCAKPKEPSARSKDLRSVLILIGFSEHAVERLEAESTI